MTTRKKADLNVGKLFIDEVNGRMKAECHGCGDLPDGVRLRQVIGSGKWAKTRIFCWSCGRDHLEGLVEHFNGLVQRLQTEPGEEG